MSRKSKEKESSSVDLHEPKRENKIDKMNKTRGIGFKYATVFRNVVSLLVTLFVLFSIIVFIEDTEDFQSYFGKTNIRKVLKLDQLTNDTALFYQHVLAKAITSSEISVIQMSIMLIMIFLAIKLILLWFGSLATGIKLNTRGTIIYMSMCIILLPALGMLSTVIGILSSGKLSQEETKLIIFGPSGLGILGYLIATVFYHLAEYLNKG